MSDETKLKLDQRRLFINRELERLKRDTATYEAELAELDVAERVYARISGAPAVAPGVWGNPRTMAASAPAAVATNGADEEESDESGPTLPVMVFQILDEAKAEGKKGVDSSEMLKIIHARWKPEFTPDQLRPTLWRMVKKQKKLRKRGRLYSRVEEAAAEPSQGQLDVVRH
jgi:hypothetical protein